MNKVCFVVICFFAFLMGPLVAQSHWESIVKESDEFKYYIPQNAPVASWKDLSYIDALWASARGGFGYGDNDDNTIVPSTTSLYLRRKFNIPASTFIETLILDIDYDDAFVAYLNGEEIARSSNLPDGTPGLSAVLSTDHEALMYGGGVPARYILDPSIIRSGQNILAVHVINMSLSSSDLSARIFLNAEIEDSEILFGVVPSWFKPPIVFLGSNLPLINVNTQGQSIPDEPKIMAMMQVINQESGLNNFTDTVYEYDGDIGIETRGNTAQLFPKKSFTVETRFSDGSNNNVELLGMPKENDWVFYGPYTDKSLMRNALAYEIGNGMNRWCPRTRFVELMINEEYRGVYLLTEKLKIDKNRLDIANLKPIDISGDELTGGYLMSIDRDQEGSWNSPFLGRTGSVDVPISYVDPAYKDLTDEQRNYIRTYITDFEVALDGDNFKDSLLGYRNYIDVVSFIDYFILTELSRDLDGYRVSVFFHKDKDSNGGKLNMSPFWDYNLCFGNADFMSAWNPVGWASDGIGVGDWYEVPFWWDRFREDPYFETTLKYRWEKLRTDVISKNTINEFIDSCQYLLSDAQQRNFEKFNILGTRVWPNYFIGSTYDQEVNYLKDWMSDRIDWLDLQMDAIEPSFPNKLNEHVQEKKVSVVYPNPFSNEFTIDLKGIKDEIRTIELYNVQGTLVLVKTTIGNSGRILLDQLEHLSRGVYFCVINTNKSRIIHKVIK